MTMRNVNKLPEVSTPLPTREGQGGGSSWPKALLEVFDDPLLDGVRPKVAAPTANDRMQQKLAEVNAWIALHGREPKQDGDLKEKMMYAAMATLKAKGIMDKTEKS